ncbi:uncharacterized protein PHACADRAFT_255040 [Phanerochaete carnosa HHB-10118-sp]|uniref:Uncharacterized protein n=1 Tax=Phanerochaete carnosa (strain HHB-10118-sp) TaxID=650164 RepID=K5WDK8_PHACS|nr:uncharacterized protein PHACADRAFT_255040 [Phanerochaete carnosa HHB-10118-sp]EKM57335.1 hypothetical protein PHACADRAFT_255040 [Phanerochaete carnosa HHB-10118-sp]
MLKDVCPPYIGVDRPPTSKSVHPVCSVRKIDTAVPNEYGSRVQHTALWHLHL